MSVNRFIIIIPYFNVHEYIRECIESVLVQTHSNWIAICADDHSEEGSSDMIPDDPRIIKRCNSHRVAALRNVAELEH